MQQEKFSLKDHLFNAEKVAFLAEAIAAVYPNFEKEKFQAETVSAFPNLELKERIAHIRQCLRMYLPSDYQAAVRVILAALPIPLDENLSDDDFGDFIHAPYSDFVAHYGCDAVNLDFSLAAIKEITKRFSAEYAIRFFINTFPSETMQALTDWAKDSNYHVRRLCSEGTRPMLPWAQKIVIKPEATLPILHQLFVDKTRFVTRSVANHLNDITKKNPDLVLEILQKWQNSKQQSEKEMAFIIKHALRNLIKDGNAKALALVGIGDSQGVTISDLQHDESIKMNNKLHFSFLLRAETAKPLLVDYIVHFQSKQSTMSNKKVFKLSAFDASPDVSISVKKSHVFRADMSTRQLYAGTHKVDIQVNGSVLASFEFELM